MVKELPATRGRGGPNQRSLSGGRAIAGAFGGLVLWPITSTFRSTLPAADAGLVPIEAYLIPLPEEEIRDGSLALYAET